MLAIGGKRIRPCLSLMASNLFTDDIAQCIPVALAMEIFHNFTLVHDDIMDNSSMRRGMQSVHQKWNISAAILSGDAMIMKAYELLMTVNDEHLREALHVFNKTAIEICEGQQLDIEFETRSDVTLPDYLHMIKLKTSVLLGCCMYCGALTGGADLTNAELLYDFGVKLGTSFQIQDDMLDCFGDEAKTGKKTGGDIIRNKKTYLLQRTLEKADSEGQKHLQKLLLNNHMDEEQKINSVIELYNKYEVKHDAENEIVKYYNDAVAQLQKVSVWEERKIELYRFAARIYKRDF
jgi:geranylgeranyl diphosphate synthase type II